MRKRLRKLALVVATLLVIAAAIVWAPVAGLLSIVLIGGAQAIMMALGAVLVVLWVVVMGWQLACGDPTAWREVRNFLGEARRLWAETPWLVVGIGLFALFFLTALVHAIFRGGR